MADRDREMILRRRARLLTSALTAVVGCSGAASSSGGPSSVVVVPESSATAPVASLPPAPRPQPQPQATEQPPLDTPPDATGIAAQSYAGLAREATQVYATLDQIERDLPTRCAPGAPACADRWQELADLLGRQEERIKQFLPLCPGSSQAAQRFSERARAHNAYGAERVRLIEDAVSQLVERNSWGPEALVAWKRMRRGRARMVACLSCIDW